MSLANIVIRLATEADLVTLLQFDPRARQGDAHGDFIQRAVRAQSCYLAFQAELCGYVIFDYHFFELGFVSTLYVDPAWRQRGVGQALMQYVASICQTDKLFTSTNLSNQPMQALLAKLGYKLSGVIHDLDEGDPELIYVKLLRG